ncbi:thioredoxin domain-containing protein 8-like [Rhinolophus ferrumequinum]|uniref:thioredoxin domain-containing protein 8-like n=1 Tax=Rhinolophus ferrumequinum TaxID=59479 RepID=UPI00140FD7FD|nr:thioredoxin domain-containing protein 8-like [Rhinolophus ferrumequinum]
MEAWHGSDKLITPYTRGTLVKEESASSLSHQFHLLETKPNGNQHICQDSPVKEEYAICMELTTSLILMDEFKTFLKSAGCKLVVVEFSAKWCDACKKICPLVHAMSLQYQNVMFASVDVDNSWELAQTYHIRAIPTFQMFKQAQQIFEFCGADAKKLEVKIQELM